MRKNPSRRHRSDPSATQDAREFLARTNAKDDGIDQRWDATNEQWWDWYLSLAHNPASDDASVKAPEFPDVAPSSLDSLDTELAAPYPLSSVAIAQFRRDGYVKLKDVCSAAALLGLREEMTRRLAQVQSAAMRFPSCEMMWTIDPVAQRFVTSRRLARIAAELLGVSAVRLYHDNALSKLPGCGRTPWHYDAHHYPIASEHVVTVWIPLQETPIAMGPLAFARGIDAWRLVADLPFSKFDDSYDRGVSQALEQADVPVDESAFDLGEVSFHHTRSLHTAGPNRTDLPRMALATTYLEDGAKLVASPTLISGDFAKFVPGASPGDPIATPLNPVLYDREAE
ncbi:MAG: phytanoyl-CoA dioxygenase family protein [Myxococcota bacterium]